MITINATKRDTNQSLETLRAADQMPAVFYGAGHVSTPITVNTKEFIKALKEAGESTTVTLTVGSEKISALIHDVQFEALRGTPMHADFLVVDMNKKITVAVPLEFVGVAPAAKNNLGMLVKVMHEIEIEALPKDLPHTIDVDLETLTDLNSQISAGAIKLPSGVTLVTDGEEVVASIAEIKEIVEESAPVDLTKIEVEKKGKKEEETPTE